MHFSDRFLHFIAEKDLFSPQQPILLAVSGGKDSVLMAHVFAESGLNFGIAHCNFQLRGEASDGDEEFVKQLAVQLKIPFYVMRFETEHYARENGLSIQMAARDLRYAWLEKIRASQAFHRISIAHHQTDSVETVFLNLLRGTGLSGLTGIAVARDFLIRPFLGFTAEEIAQEVKRRNLPFREDASNASTKYKRNAVRLEVLPVLRRLNPDLEKTFMANAKRFQQVEDFLQSEVERTRRRVFIATGHDEFRIAVKDLKKLKPLQLKLYELFRPYAFTETVLADLVREWNGTSGKLFFSRSHQLLLNRGELMLKPISARLESELILDRFPQEIQWYGQRYRVALADRKDWEPVPDAQALDFDRLELPLMIRSWQEGDRFRPLGMKGSQKISDFLISRKVPRYDKGEVPLVEDAHKAIVSVLPWRIDDRYKITSETKKVLIFEKINHE